MKNTSIQWEDNDIGDEGTMMLSKALETNSTLTDLYLGSGEGRTCEEMKWTIITMNR